MSNKTHNRLLGELKAVIPDVESMLERIPLEVRQVVETPGMAIPHVYFVETGMLSVVAMTNPANRIEVAMIGFEGMSGTAIALGGDRATNETLVQSAGSAFRMRASVLQESMARYPQIQSLCRRYAQAIFVQASQTALANARGRLTERLARWFLMWQDRLKTDHLCVSQQFISTLLGVRRASITLTVHILEGRHLIRATRANIVILDRAGLYEAANGFYGVAEAEYERLFGIAAA